MSFTRFRAPSNQKQRARIKACCRKHLEPWDCACSWGCETCFASHECSVCYNKYGPTVAREILEKNI